MPFGVDPKTVLCIFFKQGNCEKGRKCKFSHDLAVERKGEKRDLYSDTRDKEGEEEAKRKDDMADWDEGEEFTFEPPFFFLDRMRETRHLQSIIFLIEWIFVCAE